jgi:hypothetical protein
MASKVLMTTSVAVLGVILAAGCASRPAPPVAADGAAASYPDKAFKVTCGAETFDIHFTGPEAHLSTAQGVSMLPRLSGGGAATYTNGRMTFTRSGDGSTISFARGRRAAEPCTDVR